MRGVPNWKSEAAKFKTDKDDIHFTDAFNYHNREYKFVPM